MTLPLQFVHPLVPRYHTQAVCKVLQWLTTVLCSQKEREKKAHIPQAPFSASSLKFPSQGFPSSPQFHLEFSGLIEELHRRVYYRLRNDPFHIWSSKELLVRSLWVHLSHMWSFLQNQYGYFSVWQVNMKYHIMIEKQSCTFEIPSTVIYDKAYSYYSWISLSMPNLMCPDSWAEVRGKRNWLSLYFWLLCPT